MPLKLGDSMNPYQGHIEYLEATDEEGLLHMLNSIRVHYTLKCIYPKPNGNVVAWIVGDLRVQRKLTKGNDNG